MKLMTELDFNELQDFMQWQENATKAAKIKTQLVTDKYREELKREAYAASGQDLQEIVDAFEKRIKLLRALLIYCIITISCSIAVIIWSANGGF